MKTSLLFISLSTILLFNGCNSTDTSVSNDKNTALPSTFQYKAINNRGTVVETALEDKLIKIYSNSAVSANPQARHIGVVVNVDGQVSPTMQIEDAYLNTKIVAVLYDKQGNELAVSKEQEVNDVPVVVLNIAL
jgi:hypothetical protein